MLQWRNLLRSLVPPGPYRGTNVTRAILEPSGRIFDLMMQVALEAVYLRFPSYCPSDALKLHSRSRRIIRGPYESDEQVRVRLVQWLDVHRMAGLYSCLAYAIQSFLAPDYPMVRVISRFGLFTTIEPGACLMPIDEALSLPCTDGINRYVPPIDNTQRAQIWFFRDYSNLFNYDGLAYPERATRMQDVRIAVYPGAYVRQGNYDSDVLYDQPTTWGFVEPQGTFDALRSLISQMQSAQCFIEAMVFPPSTNDFNPIGALPMDPGWPDGWWAMDVRLDNSGIWIPAKRRDCRFMLFEEETV